MRIGYLIPILAAFLAPVAEAVARPNVVLIMSDDQGYGDLGVHGNPIIRTPNIDALAGKAAVLPSFYVSPVCTPTRASGSLPSWSRATSTSRRETRSAITARTRGSATRWRSFWSGCSS